VNKIHIYFFHGTPLINPICYYFVPVGDYKKIENETLLLLDDYRLIDDDGNKTEWVRQSRLRGL
jgi:hypothetical protein